MAIRYSRTAYRAFRYASLIAIRVPIFASRGGRSSVLGHRFAIRGSRFAICYLLFAVLALFIIANWCFPLPKAQLHRPSSPIVLDRNGEWLRAFLAADGMWRLSDQPSAVGSQQRRKRYKTSLFFPDSREPRAESLSPFLHQAILTSEDRWFYYHFGINPISIATAFMTISRPARSYAVDQLLRCSSHG